MAKRKHIGTVVIAILVAILLTVGVSGWLFWQSVQRVIGEAQQAGEYAAEAQQSVGQGDFKQALEQMDSAGSHIVTAHDETQGALWQAAEYVPYYGSDVKAVRGMLAPTPRPTPCPKSTVPRRARWWTSISKSCCPA